MALLIVILLEVAPGMRIVRQCKLNLYVCRSYTAGDVHSNV